WCNPLSKVCRKKGALPFCGASQDTVMPLSDLWRPAPLVLPHSASAAARKGQGRRRNVAERATPSCRSVPGEDPGRTGPPRLPVGAGREERTVHGLRPRPKRQGMKELSCDH